MRILLLVCFVIALSACQSTGVSVENDKGSNADNDIVFKGAVTPGNVSRIDTFIDNTNKGKSDEIRIVTYTIEGDPLYHILEYGEGNVRYTFDDSKDKYGGSNYGSEFCASLEREESEKGIKYYLMNCSTENGENFELEIPA